MLAVVLFVLVFGGIATLVVVNARRTLARREGPLENRRLWSGAPGVLEGGPHTAGAASGSLWTERLLLVRTDLGVGGFEVLDGHGRLLASGGRDDVVRDAAGTPQLRIAFAGGEWTVAHPEGGVYGHIRLDWFRNRQLAVHLVGPGGEAAGHLSTSDGDAWHFAITDAVGRAVVRITRARDSLRTAADAVEVLAPLSPPLQPLALAAAVRLLSLQQTEWIEFRASDRIGFD